MDKEVRIFQIEHSRDNNGDKVVTVPLTNSQRKVTMLEKDLDNLIARGIPLAWKLAAKQVVLIGKKRVLIARTMVGAEHGDRVLFKDKDFCNMRRDNILYTDSKRLSTGDIIFEHIYRQGMTETSSNHAGSGMA